MIAWDKCECCENCGSDEFFETDVLKISGRRIRLCQKCMAELRDGINKALGYSVKDSILSELKKAKTFKVDIGFGTIVDVWRKDVVLGIINDAKN